MKLIPCCMLIGALWGLSPSAHGEGARLFAPEVLGSIDSFAPAFSLDGRTFYFTRGLTDGGGLFVSNQTEDGWSEPVKVAFSNVSYSDNDLFPSPDGVRHFFMSKRPVSGSAPRPVQDIWYVNRHDSQWSEPVHIPEVNSDARDGMPSVSADGSLYFFSERPGGYGSSDIYRSDLVNGRYTKPENLGPKINTDSWDGVHYVSPDESFLIFFSTRPGGYGDGDLWVSYNRNGEWDEPENLGPVVNSAESDVTPHVSPDGRYLFFARAAGAEHKRSIFYVPVEETPLRFDRERFVRSFD